LKPKAALVETLKAHGVDLAKPVLTTCGSGVSAAILALAVEEAGGEMAGLYDGSWAEWGARDDCPVVTGAAGG
jgi:thiosulfate/3-mercaptopyruvate sulfurtransferase